MAPRGSKRNGVPVPDGPTDKQIDSYIDQNVMTTYHYAGTCRMGTDAASVVDPSLRVRGAIGLRVADASIIPIVPVSAMNAPSMMIGWRAAAAIKSEQRAAPALVASGRAV
jgi:choline dehydrogenase-like flavoprotein